ncbi:MAG: sigma-70 family RNA polymerase sigma factor [Clostridia bacterium]|nr:sigma-70 family RNA polymerase sigma factor [Clostridia bacterium]
MTGQNIPELFKSIYDSTSKKVLGYIVAKCSNTADIEDLFQDVYCELYLTLDKKGAKFIKNGEAFVMNIAKQKLYKYYQNKKPSSILVYRSDDDDTDALELLPDDVVVEDKVIDDIVISELRGEIAKKPLVTQKIFYLYYSLDMTIPQIAKLLKLGESYVKNKLYRTIKELRQIFSGKDENAQ